MKDLHIAFLVLFFGALLLSATTVLLTPEAGAHSVEVTLVVPSVMTRDVAVQSTDTVFFASCPDCTLNGDLSDCRSLLEQSTMRSKTGPYDKQMKKGTFVNIEKRVVDDVVHCFYYE